MKTNHVLIDYENVQPELAETLSAQVFKVWVFVGAQQAKVKFDLVDLVQRKGDAAKIIRIGATARNALDFHISYYLGRLAHEFPEDYFHVIGNDAGLDPLLAHLTGQGVRAARWKDVADIPIVKAPAESSDSDKLSRIIEYLVSRGDQRPASWKALVGSAAAIFHPRLSEEESVRLLTILESHGIYGRDGNKLRYGLPD
ncbi:PIN domain-containing protein [Paucibacter sp. O1-1]|nr:PIN domain-containing protein [Paucibacter sp. O1-1]MCU7374901.1 PIN domain-containing protein [Paucibacter sp. O1-1]MDA3829893.1 PIN domain-containing protein [Paucibacter sp. O1-1]MDA3829903.1 PIN domain-containing protein [Paucibacter sp. O1-1]